MKTGLKYDDVFESFIKANVDGSIMKTEFVKFEEKSNQRILKTNYDLEDLDEDESLFSDNLRHRIIVKSDTKSKTIRFQIEFDDLKKVSL